jgi:hypothetical protein
MLPNALASASRTGVVTDKPEPVRHGVCIDPDVHRFSYERMGAKITEIEELGTSP